MVRPFAAAIPESVSPGRMVWETAAPAGAAMIPQASSAPIAAVSEVLAVMSPPFSGPGARSC